jgi:hypothetical protein
MAMYGDDMKKGGMKKGAAKKAAMKKGAAKKGAGMTAAQKKLPPFIQKAIMGKKKKAK